MVLKCGCLVMLGKNAQLLGANFFGCIVFSLGHDFLRRDIFKHAIGINKGRWWNTMEVSWAICMAIQCFVGSNVRFSRDTNGFYVEGKEYPYLWELWIGLKIWGDWNILLMGVSTLC
jgi:hypothetical protein